MEEKEKMLPEGWWRSGCCHGGKHILLRWILGIIILSMVFWLGFRLGEFKTYIRGGGDNYGYYGRHMKQPWGNMMNPGYYYGAPQQQSAPPKQ